MAYMAVKEVRQEQTRFYLKLLVVGICIDAKLLF